MNSTSRDLLTFPRWSILITGLAVYTSIGWLFLVPSVLIRITSFLVLWITWGRPRISALFLFIAGIVATSMSLLVGQQIGVAAMGGIGWTALAGGILVGLVVYPNVFHGADWASVALLFGRRRGENVAHASFFAFKIIPQLENRIRRISVALRIYGHRKYAGAGTARFIVALDGLLIYFLEAIDILLGNERVMMRRHPILFDAAGTNRFLPRLRLLGSWAFVLLVWVGFLQL